MMITGFRIEEESDVEVEWVGRCTDIGEKLNESSTFGHMKHPI